MRRNLSIRLILTLFLVIAVLAIAQISRLYMFLKRGYYTMTPFTQENPNATLRILVLGDSTAVGTGAKTNQGSVAGWFGQAYPLAQIDNDGRNGRKIGELLKEYDFNRVGHYNLAIIQIGGNDILRFTSLDAVRLDLQTLLTKVKTIADHVIILHSGNVGIAPLFIWPSTALLTARTKEVRAIYQEITSKMNVMYVDLYHERNEDPLNKNIDLYYSLDYLHPSAEGYKHWFQQIQHTLENHGISL